MKKAMSSHKTTNTYKKNNLEKLQDDDNLGGNLFDQLLGKKSGERQAPIEKPMSFGQQRKEFTIFTHNTYHENELIPREIENLKLEIRREIQLLKATNKAVVQEAVEIEKAAMQTSSEKSGVYQVRFLELLLTMIRGLRSKVGEAGTWMKALQSKKKKRGSLFAAQAKKKGTQYSQSQELQNARSIQ